MITHGGRLPAETSRFFGRSREAAAIRAALGRSRLVTLTGPGGVGKTRLALRVAAELTQAFPDGIHLVRLSAVRDPAGLRPAVAAALGVPAAPGGFAAALSGRRLLLILDTCEHLVDACAALADAITSDTAGPVILVTSRQPLGLPAETVLRIPPLGLTGDASDAVALFADRAGAAQPGFVLTEQTRPKVAWLCRAVDGLPLAIELAALRLRAVGLDELLVRLPGRLRLLAGGRRADEHQQTVEASITWSYDLCGPAERLLWNRLSVFSGGFSLAAAAAVGGAGDIPGTLAGLVDKSVVLRDDSARGEARYRLLEVVKEQGMARADPADAAACAARHRDHYLQVARDFATAFVGPDQVRLAAGLTRDLANLRVALEWSPELPDHHQERSLNSTRTPHELPGPPAPLALACRLARWVLVAPGPAATGPGATGLAVTVAASAAPGASLLADLVAALADGFEALARGDAGQAAAQGTAVMAALPDGERWVRGWAEWIMGLACWLDGAAAVADQWLRAGLRHLAPFGDDLAIAQFLEAFGWLAARSGRHRRAARLHGAADLRWRRLTEAGCGPVTRLDVALLRAERDRAERTARNALGAVVYATEHAAGAALIEQDALRCALGELPTPPAPGPGTPGPGTPGPGTPGPGTPGRWATPGQPMRDLRDRQPARDQPALAMAAGHPGPWRLLTAREREVALLVAKSMTNKDIATRLRVAKRTVDAHIEHILAKLSYASRVQIVTLVAHERALEEGPATTPEPVRPLPVPRRPQEQASAPVGIPSTRVPHSRPPSG